MSSKVPFGLKELKVRKPERWPWSSVGRDVVGGEAAGMERPRIEPGPVVRGRNWLQSVEKPLTAEELALVRHSVVRGTPFGDPNGSNGLWRSWGLNRPCGLVAGHARHRSSSSFYSPRISLTVAGLSRARVACLISFKSCDFRAANRA